MDVMTGASWLLLGGVDGIKSAGLGNAFKYFCPMGFRHLLRRQSRKLGPPLSPRLSSGSPVHPLLLCNFDFFSKHPSKGTHPDREVHTGS
jgi:hypothetical protein